VKPDLLIEVKVSLRPLALVRIASVENARTIARPGRAAAAGGVLNAWDLVGELFARVDLEEM
jgi:hypothetical protein